MNNLFIIKALDETTNFLSKFGHNFECQYITILPSEESISKALEQIKVIPEESIIIFLGHGNSTGLYSPESLDFEKRIIINTDNGNNIFKNKFALILSCNSNLYIKNLNGFKEIIGFGNILSSIAEVGIEAEYSSGVYRKVESSDIDIFNESYSNSIICALKLLTKNKINFLNLPKIIEFFINKKINEVLLNKRLNARVEIAKLLFEFKNEIVFIKNE